MTSLPVMLLPVGAASDHVTDVTSGQGPVTSGHAQWPDPPNGSSSNATLSVPIYYYGIWKLLAWESRVCLFCGMSLSICPTFPDHLISHQFLVGFVLLDL